MAGVCCLTPPSKCSLLFEYLKNPSSYRITLIVKTNSRPKVSHPGSSQNTTTYLGLCYLSIIYGSVYHRLTSLDFRLNFRISGIKHEDCRVCHSASDREYSKRLRRRWCICLCSAANSRFWSIFKLLHWLPLHSRQYYVSAYAQISQLSTRLSYHQNRIVSTSCLFFCIWEFKYLNLTLIFQISDMGCQASHAWLPASGLSKVQSSVKCLVLWEKALSSNMFQSVMTPVNEGFLWRLLCAEGNFLSLDSPKTDRSERCLASLSRLCLGVYGNRATTNVWLLSPEQISYLPIFPKAPMFSSWPVCLRFALLSFQSKQSVDTCSLSLRETSTISSYIFKATWSDVMGGASAFWLI